MNIAIAGFGREGRVNYEYWNKDGNTITIVDERDSVENIPDSVPTVLGKSAFEDLANFDMVVRTAGLSPYKIKTNGKIWSATNEFFAKCPAPIIGVTGTKGKGTTSSLIASILRAAGKNVHLLGNIGTPALAELPKIVADDVVVYELSSFQLWDIERSPHIAVLLGVEPDHLNVHEDLKDYYEAKANIFRWQQRGDVAICHPTNTVSQDLFGRYATDAEKIEYGKKYAGGVFEQDGIFCTNEETLFSVQHLQLPGAHNVENACAALTVAVQLGVEKEAMKRGLETFEGLEHRIEKVREVNGVLYVNDSFSSAPSATVAAIRSFDQPEIVIIGGVDKGTDFSELVTVLAQQNNIKKVLLIGQLRGALGELLAGKGVAYEVLDATTMRDVVAAAKATATNGDVVLLSPGTASFDMFKDFYDRGTQFKQEVEKL